MGGQVSLEKVPTMVPAEESSFLIREQKAAEDRNKLFTVVLDLDGTLGCWGKKEVRNGSSTKSISVFEGRPFVKEFLDGVSKLCELVIWTASAKDTARLALGTVDRDQRCYNLVYKDPRWYPLSENRPIKKNLEHLGRDMSHILLVDDRVDFISNYNNSIIIKEWDKSRQNDDELKKLLHLIKIMVRDEQPVPDFLQSAQGSVFLKNLPSNNEFQIPIKFLYYSREKLSIGMRRYKTVLYKQPDEPLGIKMRKRHDGVLEISGVKKDSPAAQYGFSRFVNSKILEVNGVRKPSAKDIQLHSQGVAEVTFLLKLKGNSNTDELSNTVIVELTRNPGEFWGLVLRNLKNQKETVYLSGVTTGSSAHQSGIEQYVGSKISQIDGITFESAKEMSSYMQKCTSPTIGVEFIVASDSLLSPSAATTASYTSQTICTSAVTAMSTSVSSEW
eukprot:TRINITY_DN9493_c0_g1_i1.p1 TRINITY_DN9493_c0_g1~~TRINITY_DN9493_c0_g1_i1.p1  ORF type:complete len:459 (+),score=66.84 TRINITY_DN9493_c0_g1_i1:45-1379(+)